MMLLTWDCQGDFNTTTLISQGHRPHNEEMGTSIPFTSARGTRMAEIQDGAGTAKNVKTDGLGHLKNIGLAKVQNEIVNKTRFKSGC